jgi:FkbM family methyltransferase
MCREQTAQDDLPVTNTYYVRKMIESLRVLVRKIRTASLILVRCSTWPKIFLAKTGLSHGPEILRLRDGLVLKPMPPLLQTWGEIFEPLIADVYNIRNCNPDLIIDVGANVGAFSCLAAHLHPHATVLAFEPSPAHANLLEQNAKANHLPNIVLHREAVTKDGRDVIFSQLGAGGSSGLFFHEGGTSTKIGSTTLGSVDFSQSRFLFLKLDCEGAEGEVIEWICANLTKLPSHIMIACEYHHWCPIPRDQILRNLETHRFTTQAQTLFDESYLFASFVRSNSAEFNDESFC